jgi:hypothetical protein
VNPSFNFSTAISLTVMLREGGTSSTREHSGQPVDYGIIRLRE